jgi:chloramphenicol 3-O phosphotransferase
MNALLLVWLSLFAALPLLAAQGTIVLLNGTSSAGKSSLAETMVQQSRTKYEVISFDDFRASYEKNQQPKRWGFKEYSDVMTGLYQHAKAEADAGKNVIIDTVEFDRNYDAYCQILDCAKVIKAIVYCPPEHLMKRIEKRNSSGVPSNRRPLLLSFDQFVQTYKSQTSTNELVVARTHTRVLREALNEAIQKAGTSRQYQSLYQQWVKAFGIDKDQDVVIVPKGKYDLVVNTKWDSKKKNVDLLDDYVKSRGR